MSKKVSLRLFALLRSGEPYQLFLQICQNLCGTLISLLWLLRSRIWGYCRRKSKLRHLIFMHSLDGRLTGGRARSFVSCRLDLGGSKFGRVSNLVLCRRLHFKSLRSSLTILAFGVLRSEIVSDIFWFTFVIYCSRAWISDWSYSHMTRLRYICRFDWILSKVTRIGTCGGGDVLMLLHQSCDCILFWCTVWNLIRVKVPILVVACAWLTMMLMNLSRILWTLKTSWNAGLWKCGIRCRIFSWIVSVG